MTQTTPIDPRESAAILAGLRLLQALRNDEITTKDADMDVAIDDIESDGGNFEVLTSDEIDELCERVNIDGLYVPGEPK